MVTIPDILALDIRCDLGMENTSFGLAPQEETGQVLVFRVCFDDFQCCRPVANHVGRQPPLLKTHRNVICPADAATGKAVLDKR